MKWGIPILILGILLLFVSIPLSILGIVGGFDRLNLGDIFEGVLAYVPIACVLLGLVLTTIGATRVFKN
jgi:hypothetical protein